MRRVQARLVTVSVMTTPLKGKIGIDIRDSVPDWAPYAQPTPPAGARNVLYIVLDDEAVGAFMRD